VARKGTVGRALRLAAGWALTLAGLVLIPVPILPGFVLLIPGLALLCAESRFIRRGLRRLREHWLLRRAMREAEKAGLRIDEDPDDEDPPEERDEPPSAPPSGRSSGRP